jgi:hypothetical protein
MSQIMQSVRNTVRTLRNEITAAVKEIEPQAHIGPLVIGCGISMWGALGVDGSDQQ